MPLTILMLKTRQELKGLDYGETIFLHRHGSLGSGREEKDKWLINLTLKRL